MTRRGDDAVREVIPRGEGGAPGPNKSSAPGKSPGAVAPAVAARCWCPVNRRCAAAPGRAGAGLGVGFTAFGGPSRAPRSPRLSIPLPGITGEFPTGSSPGKWLRSREDAAALRAGTKSFGGTPGWRGAARHPSGVRVVGRALVTESGTPRGGEGRGETAELQCVPPHCRDPAGLSLGSARGWFGGISPASRWGGAQKSLSHAPSPNCYSPPGPWALRVSVHSGLP